MILCTNTEYIATLRDVAQKKTIYVTGGLGHVMGETNKRYLKNRYESNRTRHAAAIDNADDRTLAFDCSGLVKWPLWLHKHPFSWTGTIAGAIYLDNGVPDANQDGLAALCKDMSKDFSHILPGEFLHLPGSHCGVYIGNGLAIESTPAWRGGVQISAVANIGPVAGYPSRTWTQHGKLPWIDYTASPAASTVKTYPISVALPIVRRGDKGDAVKLMQTLLNLRGYTCGGVDGDYGPNTGAALVNHQADHRLEPDGECGPKTWGKLLEVMG